MPKHYCGGLCEWMWQIESSSVNETLLIYVWHSEEQLKTGKSGRSW